MSDNSWRSLLRDLLEMQLLANGHQELLSALTVQAGAKAQDGAYVSNLGFLLARKMACPPQQAAELMVAMMKTEDTFSQWSCEAVNGYINCKPSIQSLLQRLQDGTVIFNLRDLDVMDEKFEYACYRLKFLQHALKARGIESLSMDLNEVGIILGRPCFAGLQDWLFEPGSEKGSKALVDWIYVLNRTQDLSQWDRESLVVLAILLGWVDQLGFCTT